MLSRLSLLFHTCVHTEIFTVKYYCLCLWLDEWYIFTVIHFKSLNWNVKNLSMYEIKTSYHGKCLLMYLNSWIKIVCVYFPWNIPYIWHYTNFWYFDVLQITSIVTKMQLPVQRVSRPQCLEAQKTPPRLYSWQDSF